METLTAPTPSAIRKLAIDEATVYLEELGPRAGKVMLTMPNGEAYSYSWGAMGGTLTEFLQGISAEYFARNLVPPDSQQMMDVPATFATVRKFIREEIRLAGYQHMEFQKDMRAHLRSFQEEMEDHPSDRAFVDRFNPAFISRLNFYLIEDQSERNCMEREFKNLSSEPWHYIAHSPSPAMKAVKALHGKLVARLKQETPVHSCRVCGCTEEDCSICIERTGQPCHWVEADLCSACGSEA